MTTAVPVRLYVRPGYWNVGSSLGLEYPFVFGEYYQDRIILGEWAVWCRHCGLIFWTVGPVADWEGRKLANAECERLNGVDPNPSQQVLNDIDSTP